MLVIFGAALLGVAVAVWFFKEKSKRQTHAVGSGYQSEIVLPFEEEFELYHNALSLCSMKVRLCLAELGIEYKSHHIDLIETGSYENIRPALLSVNPGGTVPVLIHNGHPIYESHEQIRYAANYVSEGSEQSCSGESVKNSLLPESTELRNEMERWIDRSSITDDPLNHIEDSAGNAIPGQTLPLFCTMIEGIEYMKIFEGFLFHFDKIRPALFALLKFRGIEGFSKLSPAVKVLHQTREALFVHFDALESQLEASGGDWILGDQYTLADVSWLVIFERLRQADCEHVFLSKRNRPKIEQYWARLQSRPAYQVAILGHSHPLIEKGTNRIVQAKRGNPDLKRCLEGVTV